MFNCKLCGKLEHAGYIEETQQRLLAKRMCFNCDFWHCMIAIKDEPNTVRVKGKHYQYLPDNPPGAFMTGFGGSRFDVKFHDGREVTTRNMWFQGEIPERFREALPDNACFA